MEQQRRRLIEILRFINPDFPKVEPIFADEIAKQLDDDVSQAGKSWPATSYGRINLPAPTCFIEARTVVDDHFQDRGVLLQDISNERLLMQRLHGHGLVHPPGAAQVLLLTGFMRVASSGLVEFPGTAFLHLDGSGYLLDDTNHIQISPLPATALNPVSIYHPHLRALATFIPFALFALRVSE